MNSTDYEIFERYLNGGLNAGELLAFEQRLKAEPGLAEELHLYSSIQNGLKQQQQDRPAIDALSATLTKLNAKHFSEPQKKVARIRPLWWAAAAAAMIVIILLAINPFKTSEKSNQQLFAEYAQPAPLHLTERGNHYDSLAEDAATFYNAQQYEKALPLFRELMNMQPQPQIQLALGISEAFTGGYENAIKNFDELSKGKSIYAEEALEWKGLTLLRQDKKSEAVAVLQQIPATASNYKKVKELLDQLAR